MSIILKKKKHNFEKHWALLVPLDSEHLADGSGDRPPELPDALLRLQNSGHYFQAISCESWNVRGNNVRIRKDLSICFSVDTMITSQDIIVGLDKAGIDFDNITAIQRRASNNSWVVTFDCKAVKDAAMNEHSIEIAGCSVLVGDCENRVSIVKIYELPDELPDSVVIGRLSHYGRVISFRRDRVADTILNGVRTARMFIDRPIPSQTFIAGEFARLWYPSQPKTCRKCGSEDHLAAVCKSQRCYNCERPGHRAEQCDMLALCRDSFLMPTIFQIVLLFTIAQTCPLPNPTGLFGSHIPALLRVENSQRMQGKLKKKPAELNVRKMNASDARNARGRRRESARREIERRRRRKTEKKKSEETERTRNERRTTAKIGEKEGSTINTMRGDTKMATTTEGVRGVIASGIAIAFALLAIALLIAITIIVIASLVQRARVGHRCPTASVRVSHINLFYFN